MGTVHISHRETAKDFVVHAKCGTNDFQMICSFGESVTFVDAVVTFQS